MAHAVVHVTDMVCSACEAAVERAALGVEGCSTAHASLAAGTLAVDFSTPCDLQKIGAALNAAGYTVDPTDPAAAPAEKGGFSDCAGTEPSRTARRLAHSPTTRRNAITLLILAVVVMAFVLIDLAGGASLFSGGAAIDAGAGYLALFMVGALTSVHCVAMCGGINLSQSLAGMEEGLDEGARPAAGRGRRAWAAARNSALYNLGRICGYTAVGFLAGAIGSAVSPTLRVRAVIGLVTGVVMLVAGLNMLGGFGLARRVSAHLPRGLASPLAAIARKGPLFVGLVNSLMPCGPLQAIQLYALSTADPLAGALSMLAFCLGTVPLVLATGVAARALSLTWRHAMLRAGSALMLLIALFMVQGNLAILGVRTPLSPAGPPKLEGYAVAQVEGYVQRVTTSLDYNSFGSIEVLAGIPVEWTIEADTAHLINCNNQIVIAAYGVEQAIEPGTNVVRFTPAEPGTVPVTCWMGMLNDSIEVVAQ